MVSTGQERRIQLGYCHSAVPSMTNDPKKEVRHRFASSSQHVDPAHNIVTMDNNNNSNRG